MIPYLNIYQAVNLKLTKLKPDSKPNPEPNFRPKPNPKPNPKPYPKSCPKPHLKRDPKKCICKIGHDIIRYKFEKENVVAPSICLLRCKNGVYEVCK